MYKSFLQRKDDNSREFNCFSCKFFIYLSTDVRYNLSDCKIICYYLLFQRWSKYYGEQYCI